jgi:LmbE family N-acetylglucosaminyl deacetylase
VTVLAGDPSSQAPPGRWDQACGFRSAGEAARVRREEDRKACRLLGATPIWLLFGDDQYGRGADDDAVWAMIQAAVENAQTILVPGFPLDHRDHMWLTQLVVTRTRPPARVALYREQPYAAFRGTLNGRSRPSNGAARTAVGQPADPAVAWRSLFPTFRGWCLKQRAIVCYGSQLRALRRQTLLRIALDEFATRGETVGWRTEPHAQEIPPRHDET